MRSAYRPRWRFNSERCYLACAAIYSAAMGAYTIYCALNGPPYHDAYGLIIRAAYKHFIGV